MLLVYFHKIRTDLNQEQLFLQKAQEIGKIGTWALDIKKNELFWTDESYKIFGLPAGEKLTYETFLNCVHPDDREYVDCQWKASFNNRPYDIEHRVLADGKIKWVREKAELEFDEKGECIKGIGFSQDITDRKRAEAELRESEERFRNVFENATIGIYRTTPDGHILLANPALIQMLGYSSPEELAARNLEEQGFEPGYSREHFKEIMERKGRINGLESAWVRKDGSTIYIRENAKAFRSIEGEIQYYDGVVEDITEQKKLQKQIQQAQKMESIGVLAGGIAHDFNNILWGVIGFLEMSLFEVEEGSILEENLNQALSAGHRAKELVRQILAFSRMSEQEKQLIDLQIITKEATKLLRASIPTSIEMKYNIGKNKNYRICGPNADPPGHNEPLHQCRSFV